MQEIKDLPILATEIMEGIDVFITGDKDFWFWTRRCLKLLQ